MADRKLCLATARECTLFTFGYLTTVKYLKLNNSLQSFQCCMKLLIKHGRQTPADAIAFCPHPPFSECIWGAGIVSDSTLAASCSLRIMDTGQLDKALQGLCTLKTRLSSHCLFRQHVLSTPVLFVCHGNTFYFFHLKTNTLTFCTQLYICCALSSRRWRSVYTMNRSMRLRVSVTSGNIPVCRHIKIHT